MESSDPAMDRLARARFTEAMTNTLSARRRPMIDSYSRVLTIVTALGAGLNAGVFFAFSSFVMTAVRRLPAAQSISAMNAINKAAPTAWFMTALVDPNAAGAAQAWAHYFSGWMAWNHVRTLAALADAACLTVSLRAD